MEPPLIDRSALPDIIPPDPTAEPVSVDVRLNGDGTASVQYPDGMDWQMVIQDPLLDERRKTALELAISFHADGFSATPTGIVDTASHFYTYLTGRQPRHVKQE